MASGWASKPGGEFLNCDLVGVEMGYRGSRDPAGGVGVPLGWGEWVFP
jgi:hypothetical protein